MDKEDLLRHGQRGVRALAWIVAVIAFLNVFYFVLRASDPVMRSDAWYFFDVFVRKAIDGSLGIADFFVKRHGIDHAQPASKLVLYLTWRFFDLDFTFEALVGVVSAGVCLLLLRRFMMARGHGAPVGMSAHVAWGAIALMLFSMSTTGTWAWSLVALEYLTFIPMLLFIWAVWETWKAPAGSRYALLAGATLLLGVVDDDSAWIVLLAVFIASCFVFACDQRMRRSHLWKVLAVVLVCMAVVRVGYFFAPMIGGTSSPQPLIVYLTKLLALARQGDVWRWIAWPLLWSVLPHSPFSWLKGAAWLVVECVSVVLLLLAHVWFWWRALRGNCNLTKFSAICLMLQAYGWLAGILIYRVTEYGSTYLFQDRYFSLYQFNVIALLMMWAATTDMAAMARNGWRRLGGAVPYAAVAILLVVQISFSSQGWYARRYTQLYYHRMAVQLWQLAADPGNTTGCLPELVICRYPLDARTQNMQLLHEHQLNVFSPRVQRWHSYLPKGPELQ
jgi:hypothetical protein